MVTAMMACVAERSAQMCVACASGARDSSSSDTAQQACLLTWIAASTVHGARNGFDG